AAPAVSVSSLPAADTSRTPTSSPKAGPRANGWRSPRRLPVPPAQAAVPASSRATDSGAVDDPLDRLADGGCELLLTAAHGRGDLGRRLTGITGGERGIGRVLDGELGRHARGGAREQIRQLE